ncbi:hypothetical protein PYJP_11510 [Pyrofollis japonicus]|uniref:hypothetical protein n=1 Tax=Pyrofollis japonicus TaxID=3060460 RepID=UPI00295A68CD|nr:hypothetical protein [Pyrofollis japonicus]BEP17799.1 hypothetical protein PYJP_11510 [Pyrofollis japonicus]
MKLLCGEKKHPGGKLARVCIRIDKDNVVCGVLLSGDFFADPEDEMEKLIERLESLETSRDKVVDEVEQALRGLQATIYGVTVEDILEALRRALSQGD